MRQALRRLLESDEHFLVIGEADNAEEALNQLDTTSADVVIMDIQLPGMDGVEATRRLKSRHHNLKVVIVSAFGEEYLIPSIEAGADGYMLKVLEPEEMINGLLGAAQGMPPIAVGLIRHLTNRAAAAQTPTVPSLTLRQHEVLRLMVDGLTSKEIASGLYISGTTLKREFRNIYHLLGVNDRAHAIAEVYRRELI